jgi:hypothetical protein
MVTYRLFFPIVVYIHLHDALIVFKWLQCQGVQRLIETTYLTRKVLCKKQCSGLAFHIT